MALNAVVPTSGLGGASPLFPIQMDYWDNMKMLASPICSESSGISSLDSEETKDPKIKPTTPKKPEAVNRELRIYYNGRNVLDLYNNLETNSTAWNFRYSHLPEKNNISMFWANRSLYNRLGPDGLNPVYTISKCECCDFQFTNDCPNSYLSETSLILSSTTASPMIFTTASTTRTDYRTIKMALPAQPTTFNLASDVFKQEQTLIENQTDLNFTNKQYVNQNNDKFTNIFSKNNVHLANDNDNFSNNINKLSNVDGNKTTTKVSDLAISSSNLGFKSGTYKSPLISYGNNTISNNDYNDIMTNSSKCNTPPNFFNYSLSLSSSNTPAATYNNFQESNISSSNNIFLNHNQTDNTNNKYHTSSSNNLYSLFNSTNTNNSANNPFSANNNNTFTNSLNPINSSRNNIASNPFTVNSQNYGRMYKYF